MNPTIRKILVVLAFFAAGGVGAWQLNNYLQAQARPVGTAHAAIWGGSWGGGGGGGGGVSTVTSGGSPIVVTGTTNVTVSYANTNCQPGYSQTYTGSAWECTQQIAPQRSWRCYDDMFSTAYGASTGPCGTGIVSGGTITNLGVGDATHPGVQLWTLSGATHRTSIFSNGSTATSFVFGTGANNYSEWDFKLDQLSNGTDTYSLRVGFIDVVNADAVDGAYFEGDSNVTANWTCKTASNSVRDTPVDSGVAISTTGFHVFRVEVDAASAVRFFIDRVQVCVGGSFTHIPSGAARATQAGMLYMASLGTGTRTLNLDYLDYGGYNVSAPR